eukprot:symbB.v1.2.004800.t1/scaffold270.1/size246978/11
MTVQKDFHRGASSKLSSETGTKSPVSGGAVAGSFPDDHITSSMPVGRRPSSRSSKLPALDAKRPGASATLHPDKTKTRGQSFLSPTAPLTPSTNSCPVRRRRASEGMVEVYGLDTRSLAAVLRRRGGSADHLEPEVGREKSAEDELPMTQAKSDIPRSEVCRSPTVEDEKIARQKHMVKLLLSDDDVRSGTNMAKSVSESADGATASQKRRLETRRRSRELQALMNDDGATEESPELDTVTQAERS